MCSLSGGGPSIKQHNLLQHIGHVECRPVSKVRQEVDHQRRPQAVSHRRGSLATSPNPGSSHSLSPLAPASRQTRAANCAPPVQTLDPSLCATCSVVVEDIEETGHTGRNARKEGEGARGAEETAQGKQKNQSETKEMWGST